MDFEVRGIVGQPTFELSETSGGRRGSAPCASIADPAPVADTSPSRIDRVAPPVSRINPALQDRDEPKTHRKSLVIRPECRVITEPLAATGLPRYTVTIRVSDRRDLSATRTIAVDATQAAGPPRLDRLTEVGTSVVDQDGDFIANSFTFSPYFGFEIEARDFAPGDAGTFAECAYGSFRYRCTVFTTRSALRAGRRYVVVPFVARGRSVRVTLRNPYGSSDAQTVELVPRFMVDVDQEFVPAGVGKRTFSGQPGEPAAFFRSYTKKLSDLPPMECGSSYTVWGDVSMGSGFVPNVGGARFRMLREPAAGSGVAVDNLPEFEVDSLASAQGELTVTYKTELRAGECADRRIE